MIHHNVKAEAGIQLLKNASLLMDHKLLPCVSLYSIHSQVDIRRLGHHHN